MSKKVIDRLKAVFGSRILETSDALGDDEATVAPADWREVALFLRDDAQCAMDHFIDLTAVDYPAREPEQPRFDVLLFLRSMKLNHRVRVKTRVADGASLASVLEVWAGANWPEREAWDMFGIRFADHPDLRRLLMYEEFEGHPLRKDYPIERTQPLVAYRDVSNTEKLPPFGDGEGQPWTRVDWTERLHGRDTQVSTGIGFSQGQRGLSLGPEHVERPAPQLPADE